MGGERGEREGERGNCIRKVVTPEREFRGGVLADACLFIGLLIGVGGFGGRETERGREGGRRREGGREKATSGKSCMVWRQGDAKSVFSYKSVSSPLRVDCH